MAGGSVILSWLEPNEDGTAALQFSLRRDGAWSQTVTIAGRLLLSRDRASAPGVIALSSRNLIAYWSQKPANKERSANAIELFMAVSTRRRRPLVISCTRQSLRAQPGEGQWLRLRCGAERYDAAFIWIDGRKTGRKTGASS